MLRSLTCCTHVNSMMTSCKLFYNKVYGLPIAMCDGGEVVLKYVVMPKLDNFLDESLDSRRYVWPGLIKVSNLFLRWRVYSS